MGSSGVPGRNSGEVIHALRALLAEKYPQPVAREAGGFPATLNPGEPPLHFAAGAVTEACGAVGGGTLLMERLLHAAMQARLPAALVDGVGSFDPPEKGWFLWVICRKAEEALRAADRLLRDGSLPLVILDLQMNPAAELRRIPSTTWYRFQRLVEPSATTLVVVTSRPLVGSAAERLFLQSHFDIRALHLPREELRLEVARVSRQEGGGRRRIA